MGIGNAYDRRRSVRKSVEEGVFLAFRPRFEKVGRLLDVCEGGLGVEYLYNPGTSGTGDANSDKNVEVDIFSAQKGVYIRRIQCKMVYDRRVEAYDSFGFIETRRCGLQFECLTDRQLAELSVFTG